MPRVLIVLWVLLMSGGVSAQSPGVEVDYREMAGRSSVVVIGTVERGGWVIHPDRVNSRTTTLPDGQRQVEIQSPSEYVVGRLVRLRVSEVLKGGARVKAGGTVNVFEPGRFPTEGAAILADRQKYVVFLALLKPGGDEFAGTVVYQPGARPGGESPFVPKTHYLVVGDAYGAVPVVPANSRVINQIRTAVRRSRP